MGHSWHSGGSLKGRRVLDVGRNEGYWSFEAAKAGADFVRGIEVRSELIEKANFVADVLGASNVEFKQLNAYQLSEEQGQFDVVLLFGLLHHLSEPVGFLRSIRDLTREYVVIDTQIISIASEPYNASSPDEVRIALDAFGDELNYG